jgi:uncharacterized protein (DUF983 family)
MNDVSIFIMGTAVAFNVLIIKWKLEHDRLSDALLDGFILVILSFVFMGTISGLMVGTVASAVVSLFLLASPPKEYFKFKKIDKSKKVKICE